MHFLHSLGSIPSSRHFIGAHVPTLPQYRSHPTGSPFNTWVESSNVDKVSCWRTKVPCESGNRTRTLSVRVERSLHYTTAPPHLFKPCSSRKGKTSTLSHKMCPRKQNTEPKLLILVLFFLRRYPTNPSYCIHILWEVCRSVFIRPVYVHWASKETYHFFRATHTKIQCIKIKYI